MVPEDVPESVPERDGVFDPVIVVDEVIDDDLEGVWV